MNTIIIDDEQDARESLSSLLELFCPNVKVVATADSVISGIKAIGAHQPDFIFLDIELRDGLGFDLINALDNLTLKVIFTTAHDKYAIKAIRLSAIDYLLKPIDPDDLLEAVERISKNIVEEHQHISLNILNNNLNKLEKIVLKDQQNVYIVKIDDIIYCAGKGSYTTFHLSNGEEITISHHLKYYERLLPDEGFYRIHSSYLVNLNKIKRITKGLQDSVIMENNIEVPISVRRKANLLDKLS